MLIGPQTQFTLNNDNIRLNHHEPNRKGRYTLGPINQL